MSTNADYNAVSAVKFLVVLNDEEQYSIWNSECPLPAGWRAEGTRGTREECLAHIDRVWIDMRPRSLRERAAIRYSGCPVPPAPES